MKGNIFMDNTNNLISVVSLDGSKSYFVDADTLNVKSTISKASDYNTGISTTPINASGLGAIYVGDNAPAVSSEVWRSLKPSYSIWKIQIINDSEGNPKVTKVTFKNNVVKKVTLQDGDKFDLYTGVLYCMAKLLYDKEIEPAFLEYIANSQVAPYKKYSSEIFAAIKKYKKEEAEKEKAEKLTAEQKQAAEHRRQKKAERRKKRHDAYIDEQAEILYRAKMLAKKKGSD